MYYQNYEDYMRSVLGYPSNNNPEPTYSFQNDYNDTYTEDEDLYPEIYRIVYPMVCKTCDERANMPITRELVEEMMETIYTNLEPETEIEIPQTREVLKNGDVRNPNAKEPIQQTRQRIPNRSLQDLIRILILRELFRRRRQQRPPMRPPRPPFPGMGPGGPRPPMPRDYSSLYY